MKCQPRRRRLLAEVHVGDLRAVPLESSRYNHMSSADLMATSQSQSVSNSFRLFASAGSEDVGRWPVFADVILFFVALPS